MELIDELQSRLKTAFIDQNVNSNLTWCPEFVINGRKQEKKHMIPCIYIEKEGSDYGVSRSFESMLKNPDFVLYQKYTYEDAQKFLHAKERGIDVHLFVRKNKEEKI